MGVTEQLFDVHPYNRADVEWQETADGGQWVPQREAKMEGHREWREARGLNLTKAAKAIGVTPAYLCDVERGYRRSLTYTRAMKADSLYGSHPHVLAISVAERMPWLNEEQVFRICDVMVEKGSK